jgi:hypothetical protein
MLISVRLVYKIEAKNILLVCAHLVNTCPILYDTCDDVVLLHVSYKITCCAHIVTPFPRVYTWPPHCGILVTKLFVSIRMRNSRDTTKHLKIQLMVWNVQADSNP